MVNDVILPDETLAPVSGELEQRVRASSEEYGVSPLAAGYGESMQRYLLFSKWPDLLGRIGVEATPAVIFYNRYFWFRRFTRLFALTVGPDAGLEQQLYQMIEQAPIDIDWDVLREIAGRADCATADDIGG